MRAWILHGQELDWYVAIADGYKPKLIDGKIYVDGMKFNPGSNPLLSSDLIDRYEVGTIRSKESSLWTAVIGNKIMTTGKSRVEAALRAIVELNLGEKVYETFPR